MSPELLVNQTMGENELCGYSTGQGSPLPGETASPKGCFQQSPSLPDSGLTELNVASPQPCPPPPRNPPGVAVPADSELSSDPPQKRYMGVRVRMPVRELLRKIRLSRGLDPTHSKSKQNVGQTLKGLEDLDILVEVLQEDLNKSQQKEEALRAVPAGLGQGFSTDPQSSWWESTGSRERLPSPTRLHQNCCSRMFNPTPREVAENSFPGGHQTSPGMFSRTEEEESSWWVQGALSSSHRDFSRSSSQDTPAQLSPAGMGAPRGPADTKGHLKLVPASFTQQDLSALSFFQFQLHREESLLRNIPADKLLAPDENGNRLLHKAVAQGRRALTYALAQRFASLNKINEKDAEKRTALHLAAEKNQHLMVLKHCKNNGVCVEVDLPDHCGLTPLHCAALAHTVLVTESQRTATDTDLGRFLRLRRDQILEGIHCLLQMGGKAELQTYSLDAPGGIPSPPAPGDFPGLCSMPASDLLDGILTGSSAQDLLSWHISSLTPAQAGNVALGGTLAVLPCDNGEMQLPSNEDCPSGINCKRGEESQPICPADESGHEELRVSWAQSPRASNSTPQTGFSGILNPITCINVNVTLVFIVSREHYPVYDVNNLYNTNAQFDWGDFRGLREEVREASQKFLLFLFQFQAPGTFVLRLSSNRHKRMYLRVMPEGGQCYEEGPFLPPTPRFAVQVGIARHRELLLKPDWAAVAAASTGLLMVLVASVALTLLCQGLGWSQRGSPCPAFRRQQLRYNLDSFSSSIPGVFSIPKCHPWVQPQGRVGGTSCSTPGAGSSGAVGALDMVYKDPTTGLLLPFPHCSLLLPSHCPAPVPSQHFLHPQTGKVLPTAGNVGYDPLTSRLVCAADSGSGGRHRPEVPIFPYIPYPLCPNTNLPVETKLPVLCPEKIFSMGGLMLDPATGIEVPVLGVTVHPLTGQSLAVGGTYLNPLTGTVAPLEIWGPMVEPEGGRIVPILGAGLDGSTGEVLPLGGLVDPSGHLMVLGDAFPEPLSGKLCRVQGVHLQQGKVLPHTGGYQAVLETDWLLSQTHVLDTLKQLKAAVLEGSCLAERLAALKAAAEDTRRTFSTKCYHTLHCLQSLGEKQEIASRLRSNGGKLGMIKYPGTEVWIPAVFGMKIPDPGGSSLMVPVLGVDWDWNTGQPFPLAGTMEDTTGKGLVPITVGARTISAVTGEIGPVIGAQTNPWTHNVIPAVQSFGALPRRATDADLIQFKEKVKDIEEMCHSLEESSLQEAERRTSKCFGSQVATELSMLFTADREEKERELQVLLEVRKALEKLMELMAKMQLEEEQIFLQLRERERHSPGAEAATALRLRKLLLALASESQEWILEQQTNVETAHTKLEYLRELSTIQTQQAKVFFSGSPQCFENYQTSRFYGIGGGTHRTCREMPQKLIPLLRSVVQVLEENRKSSLSPETPATPRIAQGTEEASRAQGGEPTAVDPSALSAREFVLYQYGISILQFLRLHIPAPDITLSVASSLPPSQATGRAFRESFFYQNSRNKLFILRDCLSSAGAFLLLLVHCLAHVAAAELSHDTNPPFLRLFHQALKACLSEMFSLRLQLSAAPQGDRSRGISQVLLKEEPFSKEDTDLLSQLFEVKVKSPTDMEAFEKKNLWLHKKFEESLNDKRFVKKRKHLLPSLGNGKDTLAWRAHSEEETCTSSSPSELEDKVDVLTEELVQVTEEEHQFLTSQGNEDLLCYYLEITSLEKDSLVKQIKALEEEIALGRKL
ncbi:hypothetical protein WISP_24023 [Willisornis vidua]|uniref:OCA domain-containing protein n=1 Tax=Willisornis vidua TaxID=1566151 RepID=A0ABQ9DNM1_9PASS|nr:hypothetical protein WISP_24023 [Willisornis vidua]